MARQRSPNRDKAFEIYKEHSGNIDLIAIAEQLKLSAGTIRGWKNKDEWDYKLYGTLRKNMERSKRKKGAQPNNKNASGGPFGNKKAEKHGLFSKYLPKETLDIVRSLEMKSPVDLLWDQILIQYAAIIRAQEIMYVKDSEDRTIDVTMQSANVTAYNIQQAWDKQANFLQAQSRAMTSLNGMIKQFNELANSDDERKLKLEQMQLNIEKTKAETKKLTETQNDEPIEIIIKRKE